MKNNHTQSIPKVGILGGGQLAQMLAEAGRRMGIGMRVLVKCLDDALPGLKESATVGSADDPAMAAAFARTVDVVTLENEFISPAALAAIENSGTPLLPRLSTLKLIQDKWHQKETLIKSNIPVAACRAVTEQSDVIKFAGEHGWPLVLKRRHMGYDGKGNATMRSSEELPAAWARLSQNEGSLYVEAFCPFERELAVMVCVSTTGETAVYPVVDSVQQNHICHRIVAPSHLPPSVTRSAEQIAAASVKAVGGIGTMGVELFLKSSGEILVNEMAPRVHNSGHYTIEACECSQFENHLRAILGWPLGSTKMNCACAVMINLLGKSEGPGTPKGIDQARAIEGVHLHVYGKNKSAKGRKMGHLTLTGGSVANVLARAERAASLIAFGA